MTRDSIAWWFGIIGSAIVALAMNLSLFPWIPEAWQQGITLAAFVIGTVSGKLATSPLRGKYDAPKIDNPSRFAESSDAWIP